MSDKKNNFTSESIREKVFAFQQSRVILTAYELDLFTFLDNGAGTSGEIAKMLGTDQRATDRLMNVLVSIGLLNKSNDKFSNTDAASQFLVKGKPEYLSGLMHSVNLWETWSTLTDAVRKGRSVIKESVKERKIDWFESFIEAMHFRAAKQAPSDISLIDLSGVNKVLDLGGGSGAYAMAFVKAGNNITAVVFDLPNVIPLTKKYVEKEGLSDKLSYIEGDYTTDNIGNGYDLIFLSAIVHSNSNEENLKLIQKCANALNTNGKVVVQDFIMDESRTNPPHGALFAINMLVGTDAGDTFTQKEVSNWMEKAGLKNITRKDTSFGTSQITGVKE